ncbi:FtsQ-type POTRA domain-containing protein [Allochromatium palmeri]|uniref:Cell division protein FtsQ n=2 Tax=Allochromatium palmeri TaxID=231048 RepID=A0A6N8EG13_9GAMM|nr:cell division protein FtsQ/DivIB [Allochromatium palmeri]MTW21998.1 FtsQ-type POTRA domain-containing protein [Allochromatium palmeri]
MGVRLRALLGILIFMALGGAGWLLQRWEPTLLPIRVIQVEGEMHHHSSQHLQDRLTERLHGGILTADLVDLKRAAEDLPWVGQASLRRVWPDTLRVQVQEYRPIARWGLDGLVTADGVVFRPQGGTIPSNLPMLEGDDKRAPEVTARYLKWRDALERIGHGIQRLSVDPRGDWRIELVSGAELRLGTISVEERLARYLKSASQLESAGRPLTVDLRYSNGFSVKWAPNADTRVRAHPDRVARVGNRG